MPALGAVLRLAEDGLELVQLRVQRARRAGRRGGHEPNADCVEDPQEHRSRWIVALDLPAPDVPPIGAHGLRQLLLRQPGPLAKLAEPVPERRVGSCRRTPALRHSGQTVSRGGRFVQAGPG